MSLPRAAILSTLIALATCAAAAASIKLKSVSDYGAVGDGRTDDTAAFNACLAANAVCWVDSAKQFLVGDVKMRNGDRLQGFGSVAYGTITALKDKARPTLVAKKGADYILNVRDIRDGGAVVGLLLDCQSQAINGISDGSFQLTLDQVTIIDCHVGFGGGSTSLYTGGAHVTNSTFGDNGTGIANLVDSFVSNADFANNRGDGVYLGAGANSNVISNSRFEWNQGFGLQTYGGTSNNNIANCVFDRNFGAGLSVYGARGIAIANNSFSRNGRNGGPRADQNAQIFISGSRNVSISGGVSMVGADDGGKEKMSPEYIIAFDKDNAPSAYVSILGLVTSGRYDAQRNPTGGYLKGVIEGAPPAERYFAAGLLDEEAKPSPAP